MFLKRDSHPECAEVSEFNSKNPKVLKQVTDLKSEPWCGTRSHSRLLWWGAGCWQGCGVQSPYHGQWDAQWCGLFRNNLGVPQEVTPETSVWPSTSISRVTPERSDSRHPPRHTHECSQQWEPCGQTPTSWGGLCLRGAPFAWNRIGCDTGYFSVCSESVTMKLLT